MVSSVQQCGVHLREDIDWRGSYERPDGSGIPGQMEFVPAQVTRRGWIAAAQTPAQLELAQAKVAASMTPAGGSQIDQWISELSLITARREEAPEIEELRLSAYRSRLSAYPADVAREALLVHVWKFFPTWAELAEVCEGLVQDRRHLKAVLDKAMDDAAPVPAEPPRVRISDEARERILAEMGGLAAQVFNAVQPSPQAKEAEEPQGAEAEPQRRKCMTVDHEEQKRRNLWMMQMFDAAAARAAHRPEAAE